MPGGGPEEGILDNSSTAAVPQISHSDTVVSLLVPGPILFKERPPERLGGGSGRPLGLPEAVPYAPEVGAAYDCPTPAGREAL